MKNQIILMAAAALAFASCSKDEMTEVNPGNAISFRTAVTRSADITTGNLNAMYVSAVYNTGSSASTAKPYFHKVQFSKQSGGQGTSTWTSNPAYYWPASGNLTFFAWAPLDLGAQNPIPEITDDNPTIPTNFNFTVANTVSDQVDFIAAKSSTISLTPGTAHTDAVPLEFHHELAKVLVQAKNTNSAYVYQVAGVRVGHVYSKGSLNISDANGSGVWTYPSDKVYDTYTIMYDSDPITLNGTPQLIMDGRTAQDNNTSMKLLPQNIGSANAWNPTNNPNNSDSDGHTAGSYLSVRVKITTHDGAKVYPKSADEFGWVAVPFHPVWVKNNQYTYVLDFSNGAGKVDPGETTDPGTSVLGGAITFTVSATGWEDDSSDQTDDPLPMNPSQGNN